VADGAVIAFAPFVFKRDHLFVFALLDDFGGNFGTGNEWVAVRHLFAVGMKEHFAERSRFAWLNVQKIDIERVAFGYTMLSPACFDNCVSHNCEKLQLPMPVRLAPSLAAEKAAEHLTEQRARQGKGGSSASPLAGNLGGVAALV
jgi:hypothetical protein